MKQKDKPESKIPGARTTTNKKKQNQEPDSMVIGTSLLKKNEFTLIIAGALVVTVIVFLVFFRSSGSSTSDSSSLSQTPKVPALEQRLQSIETTLSNLEAGGDPLSGSPVSEKGKFINQAIAPVAQKVSRLEAAMSLKVDSLIQRVGMLEQKLARLEKAKTIAKASITTKVSAPAKTPTKTLIKKPAVKSEKKTAMFHTVKKGETLWGIAQKYKTSVAKLRKLNKMTPETKIYPGTNVLVR